MARKYYNVKIYQKFIWKFWKRELINQSSDCENPHPKTSSSLLFCIIKITSGVNYSTTDETFWVES